MNEFLDIKYIFWRKSLLKSWHRFQLSRTAIISNLKLFNLIINWLSITAFRENDRTPILRPLLWISIPTLSQLRLSHYIGKAQLSSWEALTWCVRVIQTLSFVFCLLSSIYEKSEEVEDQDPESRSKPPLPRLMLKRMLMHIDWLWLFKVFWNIFEILFVNTLVPPILKSQGRKIKVHNYCVSVLFRLFLRLFDDKTLD